MSNSSDQVDKLPILASIEPTSSVPPERRSSGIRARSRHVLSSLQVLVFLFTVFELFNVALLPAYMSTLEWIKVHAVADNAAVKQHGEAVAALEQAKNDLEVARNSSGRMKAEADQAVADADKMQADAVTAQQTAATATQKAKADADTAVAQAQLNGQKAITGLQTARNAALLQRAAADEAEQAVKLNRSSLRGLVYEFYLDRCPGDTYIAKINAKDDGHC